MKFRSKTKSAEGRVKAPAKPGKKKKTITIVVIALVVLALIIYSIATKGAKAAAQAMASYNTTEVVTGDIVSQLSATAALKPADSYTVTSLVDGTVSEDTFSEGDKVEKEQLLYKLDSTTGSIGVAGAENSLQQSQENYNRATRNQQKLSIKSTVAGAVVSIKAEKGDSVMAGQEVARVENRALAELKVSFPSDDAQSFYIGQSAQLTLDGSFEILPGTVSHISQQDEVLTGNRIVRAVTIDVANPGGISTFQAASAEIDGAVSSNSANFKYKDTAVITAEIGGKVAEISVKEGDIVRNGSQLIRLTSDGVTDEISAAAHSVTSAQLSLEQQRDQQDNYSFNSPIAGTVVEKVAKLGDNIKSGNTLCTVYDLSYLTFTMNVDELDIKKISLGQSVLVTAEADEGNEYEGVITRIGINGSSSSGLTTYPVKVEISNIGGLLPGMNVKAKIVLQSANNVMMIPLLAVERGNIVLVTKSSPSAVNATEDPAPEGFVYVPVITGLCDETNVEIKSGLQEGDMVAYQPPVSEMNMGGMF